MMKIFNNRKLTNILLLLLVAVLCMGAIKEYKRITNLRVKGWLFCDSTWAGDEQWANTASVDTVAIAGIDSSTHYAFVFPMTNIGAHSLSAEIGSNGDSLFITCDTNLSSSYYYYWMILAK